ncbi:hypothetical protein MAHJHV63_50870 [Mycobacterium avium subsp. hominissuis]
MALVTSATVAVTVGFSSRRMRAPAGGRILRLENPTVTATVALVTSATEPGSVLTRAVCTNARGAGINDVLRKAAPGYSAG